MKKPREIINQLSPQDALVVLKALADSDASLARRIAEIAIEHLSEVDPQDVAEEVYFSLDFLQVEDVWERSGSTRYGYVEPYEVVDEMLEDALSHYLENLARYQNLKMDAEAMCVCQGILSGLYRFEYESTTEFRKWAEDSSENYAEDVLEKWYTKHVPEEAVDEMESFIQEQIPKWQRLQRVLKKTPTTKR